MKKDKEQILNEFNHKRTAYPDDRVLQELFEDQVQKTPSSLALIYGDAKLEYRELNERSNQLARILRGKGVGPDQIVGLMVNDNTLEMVIGILSILKAGGAYLPMDPESPKDRLQFIIEDSSMAALLTSGPLENKVDFGRAVLNIDDHSLFSGECSNLEKINQPNDLAYVIYTSGSTGRPKGVQIEHRSIVNQITGLEKLYPFDGSLLHVLLAPITFDPSVQQIFLPLTSGGKLVLVSKSTMQNTNELWDLLISNRIDIVNTVPSLMNVLLDQVKNSDHWRFKYVILAGEVFSKTLYSRLKECISAEKIINIYGPTEATINTTLYECKPEEANPTIPIGKPLINYTVLILDEHLNLVPMGAPGEICVSGVGLARGYLNNTELTAEKFIKNPLSPGERIFRTGDFGRWMPDGNIEFLGRSDNQVKVSGIRVELGEIETVLGQFPYVKEAVVINQQEPGGHTRLIGYVVPNQGQTLTVNKLRGYLKEKLPGFMVPSAFVIMQAWPLTAHGKIDRRALPAPEPARHDREDTFVSPRDEFENQLSTIWEKVLGVKPIGMNDDFFELGGTSLLGMVLLAEVQKLTGKNYPIAAFLLTPTIEQMARAHSARAKKDCQIPGPRWFPFNRVAPGPPSFCTWSRWKHTILSRLGTSSGSRSTCLWLTSTIY